jgi:hypothetical protein
MERERESEANKYHDGSVDEGFHIHALVISCKPPGKNKCHNFGFIRH